MIKKKEKKLDDLKELLNLLTNGDQFINYRPIMTESDYYVYSRKNYFLINNERLLLKLSKIENFGDYISNEGYKKNYYSGSFVIIKEDEFWIHREVMYIISDYINISKGDYSKSTYNLEKFCYLIDN